MRDIDCGSGPGRRAAGAPLRVRSGSPGRRALLWLPAAAALLLCGPSAGEEGAAPEAVGLDASLPAAKRVAGARELIALGEWDAAIDALQQITNDFGDLLIETEPGRLLNVRETCSALQAQLPAEGLARLRERIDPAVQPLFEEAHRLNDPALMRQVLRRGFAGSCGDDALAWLAEEAWRNGDLDAARSYWTMLIPAAVSERSAPLVARYPDAAIGPAEIRARLVLCSIMQRDEVRIAEELEAFRRLHAEDSGRLCGRDGILAQILEEEWEQSRTWSRAGDGDWRTYSANAQRNGVLPSPPDPVVPRWSFPLPSNRLPLVSRPRPALPNFGIPACFPVVWNDTVLINDARTVWALDLDTGLPRWPTGAVDDEGILYSEPAPDSLPLPTAGMPRFSASTADGLYFAKMGLPIATPAAGALQPVSSRLICLDLADAQGRVVWTAAPEDILSAPGWIFSGAPLPVEERLYVPLRRTSPQLEFGIACLAARSGRPVWERRIGGALQQPPALHHVVDHDLLAAAEGLVFVAAGSGVVAAVEQESGLIRWAATYPSQAMDPGELSDPAARRTTPPLYHGGRLYAAPADSDRLMAYDAGSGVEIWNVTAPGRVTHLLGVARQMLIAQGDRLWGIDVHTGRLHRPPLGFDDPEGYGFGRGAVAGENIYWTSRDELLAVDISSWSLVRRLPLRERFDWTGGNLVIAGETLLIAQLRQLGALGPP